MLPLVGLSQVRALASWIPRYPSSPADTPPITVIRAENGTGTGAERRRKSPQEYGHFPGWSTT